jgi:hypothetical protein
LTRLQSRSPLTVWSHIRFWTTTVLQHLVPPFRWGWVQAQPLLPNVHLLRIWLPSSCCWLSVSVDNCKTVKWHFIPEDDDPATFMNQYIIYQSHIFYWSMATSAFF